MSALYPRLTRDRSRRVIAGVASGAADLLGVDVKWVRLFLVAASFAGGFGVLLYAGLWVFTPVAEGAAPRQRPSALDIFLVLAGFAGALQAYDRGTDSWGNIAALTLGALLIMSGVLAVALLGESAGVAGVVVSVLVTVLGVGVLVVPLIAKLTNSLVAEREAKAVADQRAEIASRLHDSVLQTLALIQRQADDPDEVVRLARGQERELRAWLFDDTVSNHTTTFAALQKAAGEVEDAYGVVIQPVTVGEDIPFDERTEAVVLAAREAMVNAAKHAGVDTIDVYAEHLAGRLEVFVRDRGAGFDPDAVPADRHGLRDSIVGRVERVGGEVNVVSSIGNGSEIELALDL